MIHRVPATGLLFWWCFLFWICDFSCERRIKPAESWVTGLRRESSAKLWIVALT
jgi:hypothetical protein